MLQSRDASEVQSTRQNSQIVSYILHLRRGLSRVYDVDGINP